MNSNLYCNLKLVFVDGVAHSLVLSLNVALCYWTGISSSILCNDTVPGRNYLMHVGGLV